MRKRRATLGKTITSAMEKFSPARKPPGVLKKKTKKKRFWMEAKKIFEIVGETWLTNSSTYIVSLTAAAEHISTKDFRQSARHHPSTVHRPTVNIRYLFF